MRLTKFANSEGMQQATVENMEALEEKKKYQQWLEGQQKLDENKTDKLLKAAQKEAAQLGSSSYDEKEVLFLEIRNLMQQYAIGQGRGPTPTLPQSSDQGARPANSYYQRIKAQKEAILEAHQQIGKSGKIKTSDQGLFNP